MSAIKPQSDIVSKPFGDLPGGATFNERVLYTASKVQVFNNTDAPIVVMRCAAQNNDTATGNAFSVDVDAGFGLGGIILGVGESVVIAKKSGGALFDKDAGEYINEPGEQFWGEVVRVTDIDPAGAVGAPTTGAVYASAVSTAY